MTWGKKWQLFSSTGWKQFKGRSRKPSFEPWWMFQTDSFSNVFSQPFIRLIYEIYHWQLHTDAPAADFHSDCHIPGEAPRHKHMETAVCGGGTEMLHLWRLTPHILLHNGTQQHSPLSLPPSLACPPSSVSLAEWRRRGGGDGALRAGWYQVSFKKSSCQGWLKMEHDFIQFKIVACRKQRGLSVPSLQWSGHFCEALRVALMELY